MDQKKKNNDAAVCPVCKMKKTEWTGNGGKGVAVDNILYCCEGCANGTGCVCG